MTLRRLVAGAGVLLIGLAAGVLAGRWLAGETAVPQPAARVPASATVAATAQPKVLYWANPMNPAIHSDHPMKDNMGMDYVPVYARAESGAGETGVRIDARQAQNLGVRLTSARMRLVGQAIQTVGTVALDQNRIDAVTSRFSGWVVHLRVRAVGDAVTRGQILAEIYSPALYSAQQEYLIARRQEGGTGDRSLLAAARERLRLLGMPEAALTALATTGKPMRNVPILSPESGVVTALNIRQGGYVSSQASLFEITNLERVWVNVALYDYQLPWVRPGDAVQLRLPAYPGKTWDGRLSFLYPTLDPQTRTVTARLSFANPGDILRPGMYANATVLGEAQTMLAVPGSAVLRTQDGDFVMLAQAQGHFLPVEVELGPKTNGWVAIRKGLKAGDRVVESAQFLLYSESQFQSVKARMLGGNIGSGAMSTALPGRSPASSPQAIPAAPASAGSMANTTIAPAGGRHD